MRRIWPFVACGLALGTTVAAWVACGSGDSASPGDTTRDASSDSATPGQGSSDSGLTSDTSSLPLVTADAGPSVYQHHNHATRDGLYLDPVMTRAAAKTMHMDTSFVAKVNGPTYAQPLYVEKGPGGKSVLLVATEQNVVYAFDAANGAVVWQTPPVAKPVTLAKMMEDPGCGNIDPLGITGTPYVDIATRTIYLAAMTTPDDGTTKKHKIFALSLDDGSVRAGWPVDLESALGTAMPHAFASKAQNQRGALLLVDGVLYVPYGGHYGDCGDYHGWVVGVEVLNTAHTVAWSTSASAGGIWAVGGVSSDGVNLYATTGNTIGASTWGGGEAVVRFTKGPVFSNDPSAYYAPTNWKSLDNADLDLGGAAAMLVDVPGATPSALVLALGKEGKGYLVDRGNLGGIGHEIASANLAHGEINASAATFATPGGTFVAFRAGGTGVTCPNGGKGNLVTVKLTRTAPPAIASVWCSNEDNLASPIASSTGGGAESVVWATGPDKLFAYNGETGEELFAGGVTGDTFSTAQYFGAPIIANGHVYVGALNQLYAFVP